MGASPPSYAALKAVPVADVLPQRTGPFDATEEAVAREGANRHFDPWEDPPRLFATLDAARAERDEARESLRALAADYAHVAGLRAEDQKTWEAMRAERDAALAERDAAIHERDNAVARYDRMHEELLDR